MSVSKEDLLRFVKGHARVNQIRFLERMKGLRHLTIPEARRTYNDLCEIWRLQVNSESLKHLKDRRIEHVLLLRRRLDKLGSRS